MTNQDKNEIFEAMLTMAFVEFFPFLTGLFMLGVSVFLFGFACLIVLSMFGFLYSLALIRRYVVT